MAQPYVGEIRMFGGNFAPAGWMFCERGKSCPSHHAQPLGAKLNGKIRISATKGSATHLLPIINGQRSPMPPPVSTSERERCRRAK